MVIEGKIASAGNRTRAARVAGEHSTTEPPMLLYFTTPVGHFEYLGGNNHGFYIILSTMFMR